MALQPDGSGGWYLNDTVRWVFSQPVDIDTANYNSISFEVRDTQGVPLQEQVTGTFRLGMDPEGRVDARVLEFAPRLPTNQDYSNGGFKASRRYLVRISLSSKWQEDVLRDISGQAVDAGSQFLAIGFETVAGTTARELFRDIRPGPPRVTDIEVGPMTNGRVALNLLGTMPVEVRLTFDQPLDPSPVNVPLLQDSNPVHAAQRKRGRIYLEYDDPVLGNGQWVRSQVEMPVNDNRGAVVLLRPEGVLPNHATIRIHVDPALWGIAGEKRTSSALSTGEVGSFETEEAYAPQFGALVMDFEDEDLIDHEAAFADPIAEIKDGVLRARFDYEGAPTTLDYVPTTAEEYLNTDHAIVYPRNGPSMSVHGGVFNFRDIVIRKGVRVRGHGSNPLVFLANGIVRIDGQLTVDGYDGAPAIEAPFNRLLPINGGVGSCGGGRGGRASQTGDGMTMQGETGSGAGLVGVGGGVGGRSTCISHLGPGYASGGGGGSMATKGDPGYAVSSVQKSGQGGDGSNASPVGGAPGPTLFRDASPRNDFWGRLVTEQGEVILGELQTPTGGAGGGGGGDAHRWPDCSKPDIGSQIRGGGGGAGGGVLIIKAIGPIIIGSQGRISADGGRGGWGDSYNGGGYGGAGAGGMVVLMSATGIDLHAHGGTYDNRDYNFSVTADGNVARAMYGGKYPPLVDQSNAGGFGGMGIIQLHTPRGDDSDSTGTLLDDNIRVIKGSSVLTGAAKTAYLFGGDLRPDPRLLTPFYGRFSTVELQWQDTGASMRRESSNPAADGPRVMDARLGRSGPEWYFDGLLHGSSTANNGYLETGFHGAGSGEPVRFAGGVTQLQISKVESYGADYHGSPVHVIQLTEDVLPDPLQGGWSYSNYRARLSGGRNQVVGEYRILCSSRDRLLVDARSSSLQGNPTRVEILARFLAVETGGQDGLGAFWGRREGKYMAYYPKANLQIGFAFHKDPAKPRLSQGKDLDRFPQERGTFLYGLDLEDRATIEQLRALHYPFAKVRVRFNLNYTPDQPDSTPGPHPVGPESALPGLRFLLLPYRF